MNRFNCRPAGNLEATVIIYYPGQAKASEEKLLFVRFHYQERDHPRSIDSGCPNPALKLQSNKQYACLNNQHLAEIMLFTPTQNTYHEIHSRNISIK